jgi:CHAT domain-containing protein
LINLNKLPEFLIAGPAALEDREVRERIYQPWFQELALSNPITLQATSILCRISLFAMEARAVAHLLRASKSGVDAMLKPLTEKGFLQFACDGDCSLAPHPLLREACTSLPDEILDEHSMRRAYRDYLHQVLEETPKCRTDFLTLLDAWMVAVQDAFFVVRDRAQPKPFDVDGSLVIKRGLTLDLQKIFEVCAGRGIQLQWVAEAFRDQIEDMGCARVIGLAQVMSLIKPPSKAFAEILWLALSKQAKVSWDRPETSDAWARAQSINAASFHWSGQGDDVCWYGVEKLLRRGEACVQQMAESNLGSVDIELCAVVGGLYFLGHEGFANNLLSGCHANTPSAFLCIAIFLANRDSTKAEAFAKEHFDGSRRRTDSTISFSYEKLIVEHYLAEKGVRPEPLYRGQYVINMNRLQFFSCMAYCDDFMAFVRRRIAAAAIIESGDRWIRCQGFEKPSATVDQETQNILAKEEHSYATLWLDDVGALFDDMVEKLALLKCDLGRIDDATALARQGAALQLEIRSQILLLPIDQRLAYLDIFRPYSLFPLLKGTEADLAQAVLRYKGIALDSIVEDRLLTEASKESEDQKLVEQLDLHKRHLGQRLFQPSSKLSEIKHQIDPLKEELEKIEKIETQLAQHVAGLGQARHALRVRFEQVQQIIFNEGALIEYMRYPHYLGKGKWEQRYGAIVLFCEGAPLWVPLGKAKDVEALVQRYCTLVRVPSQEEALSANLLELCEVLWAPIGLALPSQTKRIIISPDGQLNCISFATLLTKDNQFLAERYSVQYVASGRDLGRELKPLKAREVVLFANPDFNLAATATLADAQAHSSKWTRGSENSEIEDWNFVDLQETQNEGDELIKKFAGLDWATTDFTAEKATKETLLKIHSPHILHLATHIFFAKEDPLAAQTEPEPSMNARQSVSKSSFFKNAMHRSGVALAGAQTTIEAWRREKIPPGANDGILTAEDVSTLDLKGTWLVTLSACDTRSGEARVGEGIMGLRRGFIQAGAQNLLMTLWPSASILQIVSDFYDVAHNTSNAPEALAVVQRNWLVKLRAEKGLANAVNLAGPFIMSSQGKP